MAPDLIKRKLAAILSADVQGYSRLIEDDEEGTIRTLKAYLEIITGYIQQHRGRLVSTGGDSILAEFPSVVDAVRCSVEIQEELKEKNKELADNQRMGFRIGVNLGDVVEEGDTILGDGVNIAARVQSLAEAGGICITGTAYDQIKNRLAFGYEYMGEETVKNIKEPVRIYRVLMEPGVKVMETIPSLVPEGKKPERKKLSRAFLAGIVLVLIAVAGVLSQFVFRPIVSKTEVASIKNMAYPLPDKPSIAVLPFANMSGDPKQEFFCDGITENIITALSKIPKILVIARNSTFTYKGKQVKVKQVSEELGVRYVLEGSVQRSGDRVRITAQLIDALSGHHLWSERYDRDLKDLFALQDEVSLKVLNAMAVKLTEGIQDSLVEKHFKGKQGLECYLKNIEVAYNLRIMSLDSNNKARRIAEEMITKWPGNPYGYQGLGWTYVIEIMHGSSKSPRESLEKAMRMAQKALAIDDSLYSAHGLLSFIYMQKREFDKAVAEGERAVDLYPNGADAHENYAHSLHFSNRFKEAIPVFQKAFRLNPIGTGSSITLSTLGHAYGLEGRFEEAVLPFQQALLRSPDNIFAHIGLAYTYVSMGREKEARAEAEEVLRINPKFSLENFVRGLPFKDRSILDKSKYIANLRKAGLK